MVILVMWYTTKISITLSTFNWAKWKQIKFKYFRLDFIYAIVIKANLGYTCGKKEFILRGITKKGSEN